jgi:glutamate racemase
MKIGFFDSGLGGLTILAAVRRDMPRYDYLFFGDTKNLPYGEKSEEEICALTRAGVLRLFDLDALLVVVACNTASAESLRKLQDSLLEGRYHDRKLLGVIIPTVETIAAERCRHALLIGTTRTVQSGKYERELEKISSEISLTAAETPTLVPLIESGELERACKEAKKAIDIQGEDIDTIVLGCTHYTVLRKWLQTEYPELNIISQDKIIPAKLKQYLERHSEIRNRLTMNGTVKIIESIESTEKNHTAFKRALLKSLKTHYLA